MTGIDQSSTRPGRPSAREWLLFALIIGVGAGLRLSHLGVGFFNMYAARDYFRALELINGTSFPAAGSEMLYGGRTIGWFYYLLLSLPLTFSPSPLGGIVLIGMLDVLALAVTHFTVRRFLGRGPALAATALFAVSPIEITMGRFMWNPACLPLFNVIAFAALLRWRIEGQRWALAVLVIAWGLAFQIHFSVYVHLVMLVGFLFFDLARWIRGDRDRLPNRPLAPLLLGLLTLMPFLWPYVAHELDTRWNNLRSITQETTNYAQVPLSEMVAPRLNPTAIPAVLAQIRVDLYEDVQYPTYVNFDRFQQNLREDRPAAFKFAHIVAAWSWLQVIFFVVGCGALVLIAFGRAGKMRDMFVHPDRVRTIAAILLLWPLIVFLGVAFLKLDGGPYPRVVPSRYFTVWYPLHQVIQVIGLRVLFGAIASWSWRSPLGWVAAGILALIFVSQAAFVWLWLDSAKEAGTAFNWVGNPQQPVANVGDKMRLAHTLVTRRGMNLRAFLERTTTDGHYAGWHNEEGIDFEMRAQPRFLTNPGSPEDVHYFIMDAETGRFPFERDPRVEILNRDRAGRLRAITYRILDPSLIIPRQMLENGFVF